ncbi:MAG: hypothetical protein JXA77_17660, partial [Bacteroidales bacterium]|nr:hypothetical protein [Bacteroidales bacterium]
CYYLISCFIFFLILLFNTINIFNLLMSRVTNARQWDQLYSYANVGDSRLRGNDVAVGFGRVQSRLLCLWEFSEL